MMKKILLAVMLVFVLALSACSLGQYFPVANNTNATLTINDSFLFTDMVNQEVTDNAQDTPSEDDNVVIILDDEQDTVVTTEEPEEDFSDVAVLTTVTVVEGETADLSFLSAQDPDGDSIRFSYSDPFNARGMWTTEDGDEGTYLVQITASDGVLSTTESVRVVVKPSNKGPVIDCPATFQVKEGEMIVLPCDIYDREGDEAIFKVSGFMSSLRQQTGFDDAGVHEVTISASDGNRETRKIVEVRVLDVNRPPVVESLAPITVNEGEFVVLDIAANDPDGDALTIEYPILFDNEGFWETKRGDAGNYELEAEVSDGEATVAVPVRIVVQKVNLPPTMTELENIVVQEGETITLNVDANDPDGDALTFTYEGFMTSRTYTTTYDDAGEYEVTITVSDGKHDVQQTVAITVQNKNRPPVFIVR